MGSLRLAAVIAQTERSLRETEQLIDRIHADLGPMRANAIRSRRNVDESLDLLRKLGTPTRLTLGDSS